MWCQWDVSEMLARCSNRSDSQTGSSIAQFIRIFSKNGKLLTESNGDSSIWMSDRNRLLQFCSLTTQITRILLIYASNRIYGLLRTEQELPFFWISNWMLEKLPISNLTKQRSFKWALVKEIYQQFGHLNSSVEFPVWEIYAKKLDCK